MAHNALVAVQYLLCKDKVVQYKYSRINIKWKKIDIIIKVKTGHPKITNIFQICLGHAYGLLNGPIKSAITKIAYIPLILVITPT